MQKYVLTFDDSMRLDAGAADAIAAKFASDLADPDRAFVCLPPGVCVTALDAAVAVKAVKVAEAEAAKAEKEEAKAHAKTHAR